MADKKISALTAATTPLAGTEVLPIVQSSTTVKVAVSDLTAGRAVSALSVSAPTVGAGSGSNLSLQADGSTKVTVTTGNKVGINTASPVDVLTVTGGNIANVITGSGAGLQMGRIAMYSTALSAAYVTYGGEIRSYSGAGIDVSDLRFYTANGAPTAERMRLDNAGYLQMLSNEILPYQGAPTTKNGAATLSGAELVTGILSYTGNAQTVSFPTGANIEGALTWAGNDVSLDFYVINTGSGTCTMGANSNTTLGALTVAAGTSAHFRIRRTATNTFTIYRLG